MDWIIDNWIEITGSIAGFIYIFFEINASKWMWPVGLFTAIFYVAVFFSSKFYADMSLQFYYIGVSIYGWYWWINKGKKGKTLEISRLSKTLFYKLVLASVLIFILIAFILTNYTDSPLPYWDAMTTALSIVATWMLARKIIEQWWLWVFIDFVSMGLYLYKGLYPTSILFVVYTALAIVGYYKWKTMMPDNQNV